MKMPIPQQIMFAGIVLVVLGMLFAFYKEGAIPPPVPPNNLEELADWEASDINRILRYYNCSDVPMHKAPNNIPANLREITAFCSTVNKHWSKAFNESKSGSALEGVKRLREVRERNE